jgi:copper oxidase (laccase) domain-containing protein
LSITVELAHATVLFSGRAEGDLGRTAGPASGAVAANRSALLARCGVGSISVPHQVHGNAVATMASGEPGYTAVPVYADGTGARAGAAAVHVADCLAIALAGEGGVAVVHAGWRGLAAGVVGAGVRVLREQLRVEGPLEAAIGPGAGGCCYEVGPEVHAALAGYGASDGPRLSLAAVAAAQLDAAGIAYSDVGVCTLCAPAGMLFSHRRDGPDTGRQAGVAWLR